MEILEKTILKSIKCRRRRKERLTTMDEKKLEETMKDIFEKLTDEQKEKAKACKNMDEFMKLAGEWGLELPDELVDNVGGGLWLPEALHKVLGLEF